MKVLRRMLVAGCLILGLSGFADFTPMPGPAINSNPSPASSSFDAAVAQNTQQALQTFDHVNVKAFLNTDDADFVGFGSNLSQGSTTHFSLDATEISSDQDAMDSQIAGGWNGE